MKLLLPILKELNIESGFGIRNPFKLRALKNEPQVHVQLWKNFDLVAEKNISFQGSESLRLFLGDIFSNPELEKATLATVQFDERTFSIEDQKEFFKTSFEGQCIFRDRQTKKWTALLYDFIPDKKPKHVYAPILHCAHSAHVSADHDSYALLSNFRPPYLKADELTQEMSVQLKSPQGELLSEKKFKIPYNSGYLISFRDEFASIGGFKPGCTMNFKGGSSQFAIFTLFYNKKTGALGVEHSLAPFYYCSGVLNPDSRKTFYKNAFTDLKENL